MFVDKSMTRRVITIQKEATIFEAKDKMKQYRIRHLPVVEADNRLIGIVTDRDIRSALPWSLFRDPDNPAEREQIAGMKVKDVMTMNPITISPTFTIQDALMLIQEKNVGALPVVDEKHRLKGIISVRDLLQSFINMLGIGQPGTLIGILVEEKIGQLKKIVDVVTGLNISFGSILVCRHWEEDKRAVFAYLHTNNLIPVKKKIREIGFELLDPMQWYMDQTPKSDK